MPQSLSTSPHLHVTRNYSILIYNSDICSHSHDVVLVGLIAWVFVLVFTTFRHASLPSSTAARCVLDVFPLFILYDDVIRAVRWYLSYITTDWEMNFWQSSRTHREASRNVEKATTLTDMTLRSRTKKQLKYIYYAAETYEHTHINNHQIFIFSLSPPIRIHLQ